MCTQDTRIHTERERDSDSERERERERESEREREGERGRRSFLHLSICCFQKKIGGFKEKRRGGVWSGRYLFEGEIWVFSMT